MIENEQKKESVKIFARTHIALSKEKTRRFEEEKVRVDFADLIEEATNMLLSTERKPPEWPAPDRIWHAMLAAVLGSLREFNVPEKTAQEAIRAVKSNLRVFYRHIGKDPDAAHLEVAKKHG